ncbi:MAG: hypothetical protein JW904_06495 [Spirochaetales bacterium]|nr:hypothetical protein [Spirochaetales bacterium]
MNGKILLGARILVVLGILVMAAAVFIETNNVAVFSTAKADLEAFKKEVEEKYKLEKPAAPVDFSTRLIAPVKPADDAAAEETAQYEQRLKKYEEMKAAEEEAFKSAEEAYKKDLSEYNYQISLVNFEKAKEAESVKKQLEDKQEEIAALQIGINQITLNVLLRFFGVILMLLGAVGVLVYADTMEKLGLLVMLGFAFKTIIGL